MAEESNWRKYVIECESFVQASKYAAEQNWWLHSWTWLPAKEYAQRHDIRVYVNKEYLGE